MKRAVAVEPEHDPEEPQAERGPRRKRKPMSIKAMEVYKARAARSNEVVYRLPEPPPGVIPKTEPRLAMDFDPGIADAYRWAGGALLSDGLRFLGYPYLAELSQRPEFRRPAEVIAMEMTRKWIKLTSTGGDSKTDRIQELNTAMENFKLEDHFRQACLLDGFFGRAHLYADTGDTDNPEALRTKLILKRETFPAGTLKGFRVVEPMWTYPNEYNTTNPLKPHFYKPQTWLVMGQRVHTSRLLTFCMRPVPDILKPMYMFGGIPLTQMAKEAVDNWLETRQNINETIRSFSKDVIKTNLSGVLNGGAWDSVQQRADMYRQTRDNRGVAMVDKEEEDFINVSTPLGGLDDLQAQALEFIAAVLGIPLVILLGVTPSGLNASSDGEIKVFYAWIKDQQKQFFNTLLTRALHMIMLHLWGEIDPTISFEFVDLWELDEVASSGVRKQDADTANVYVSMGAVDAMEVRTKLAGDESSGFHGLDLSKIPEGAQNDDVPDDGREPGATEQEPREGENPAPKP